MRIREVVVTGQHQVELQTADIDAPVLASNELLIDTEYTFISSGTELANYTGKEPKVFQKGAWCEYPWRSGYANVGIVRDVGEWGVTRAAPGDRVFTYGRHASTIRYSQDRLVAPVSAAVDPAVVAASRMAGVCDDSDSCRRDRDQPVGCRFWVRARREFGITNVSDSWLPRHWCGPGKGAAATGTPVAVLNIPLVVALMRHKHRFRRVTGGGLGNITIDAVGHSSVVMQALRATATHGQLIILGSPRVSVQGDLTDLLSETHLRWITIRGGIRMVCADVSGHREPNFSMEQTANYL